MRRSLTPYLLTAGALVVALILLVLGTAPPSSNDNPSSRASGRAGTLALYDWLTALGFNTHRITGQFALDATDVLVIDDPTTQLTEADAARVIHLLAGGGDVVLAVPPGAITAASPLLAALHLSLDIVRVQGESVPAQPFDAGNRVHRVPMDAGGGIDPAPFVVPLLVQGTTITAAAEQVRGAGRVYVLASAFPLSNDGLRDEDSSMLVLSLLERARGGAIAFDEYHHGEQDTVSDGASAIFSSPLGVALALVILAVVTYLAVSGRRIGRPVSTADAGLVPTTASYVSAMAGLYARSGSRGAVAARYADELKQRIGAGLGIDPGCPDDAVIAAVSANRPEHEAEVRALLDRARRLAAAKPDAAALLALARDVDDLERRWVEAVRPTAATAQ